MENFIYYVPTKIFFGKNEEDNIGKIISSYGYKKVFIHYGQGSVIRSGLLKNVTKRLDEENIDYILFGDVQPNPELSLTLEGIKICKKEKVDFVLAVGSGSAIDSAKMIANGAVVDFSPWEFCLKNKSPKNALRVGTILTLAAAGSEMSESCVITNEGKKRGFNSITNRPLFTILNPILTYTVSLYQTACGIVDIMMHTLERYYTYEKNVELTDYMSEGLIKAVLEAGKVVISNPNDYNARATLMWASSLSHNGLTGNGRKVAMSVHQIEHEISGFYPTIAHGAGLAALYATWCRYVYNVDIDKFARFAYNVMDVDKKILKKEAVEKGIDLLEQYFKDIGMPTNLKKLGVKKEDLKKIAHNFTYNGERMVFNDIYPLTEEDVFKIMNSAYDL